MKNNIIVVFSSHLSETENKNFIAHISKTIGTNHETFCYPNMNEFSLPEIYNKAIKEHYSKDSIFVMCHNDITFDTPNWGKLLLSKFNTTDFDIIGLAGSTYLSENGIWWEDRNTAFGIVNHTDGINVWTTEFSKPINGVKEVVVIDGVFIAFNPDTIVHKFDEEFKGFHLYDISFSMPNYLDGCKIGVITNIRITHQSIGITNNQWEVNRKQFIDYYQDELPISILPVIEELDITLTAEPKVSVVIPTKNNLKLLRNNIWSWENVSYKNYEIIIADTGSSEDIIAEYDILLSDKIKLVRYDYYNFAKINNDVVKNHVSPDSELIIFCNDDILLLNDSISRCVEIYNEKKNNVGTIGIRLHFGNGAVQHNGIALARNSDDKLLVSHVELRRFDNYFTETNYNAMGNTAAFMMINKELFIKIGGFNENYLECFEDLEFNLVCLLMGKENITACDAVAYHYESTSRKKDELSLSKQTDDYLKRLIPFYLENKESLDKLIPLIK